MEEAIGPAGLTDAILKEMNAATEPILANLRDAQRAGALPLLTICDETADISAAETALARLSEGADAIIFFGTGGSGLGGQTLAQVAGWSIPFTAPRRAVRPPRVRFYDNLDAGSLQALLDHSDLARTRFVVTSKSGGTTETLAQAILALQAVKAAGLEGHLADLFLGITEPAVTGRSNGLRALFEAHGIPLLDHPPGIGGRYSCLTIVGLLPGIARGLDARAIRAGAGEVIRNLVSATSPRDVPAAVGAAAMVALAQHRNIRAVGLMPYNDRLGKLSDWFVQLWAESLGKHGKGTIPIPALGPVDQHSQLQRFMDGPNDIVLTLVRIASRGQGMQIDPELARAAGIDFIGGRGVGDIVDAQAHAVAEALIEAGRPVRTFDLARLDERTIGALLMHLMLETIIAGRLMGVDPFDQPAVEVAKVLTRARLCAAP
jgi:glucose-6-phosphate isomerase